MELSTIVCWLSVGVGVGANARSYARTMDALEQERCPRRWDDETYAAVKHYAQTPLLYCLGAPGRMLAYRVYTWRKDSGRDDTTP